MTDLDAVILSLKDRLEKRRGLSDVADAFERDAAPAAPASPVSRYCPIYAGMRLSTLTPRDDAHATAIKSVVSWVHGDLPWLALIGSRGIGKTVLACGASEALYARRIGHRIIAFDDAIIRIEKAVKVADVEDLSAAIAAVLPMVSIFDDVGTDAAQDGESYRGQERRTICERLFDRFYTHSGRLLMISNLPQTKESPRFAEYIGARAWSRLQERGRVVACNWERYR